MVKKNVGGRPKIVLDEEQIRELARIQCTYAEIGAVMKCHPDTIHDRFSEIVKAEREHGKASLRRAQFKSALGGNAQMLIFLGTHILGQKDEKKEAVRTAADDILCYIRGRVRSEDRGTFKGAKGAAKTGG